MKCIASTGAVYVRLLVEDGPDDFMSEVCQYRRVVWEHHRIRCGGASYEL